MPKSGDPRYQLPLLLADTREPIDRCRKPLVDQSMSIQVAMPVIALASKIHWQAGWGTTDGSIQTQ